MKIRGVIVKMLDSMNHELPTNARVSAMKTNNVVGHTMPSC
jgi:predicted lipid carrier protein YhbT